MKLAEPEFFAFTLRYVVAKTAWLNRRVLAQSFCDLYQNWHTRECVGARERMSELRWNMQMVTLVLVGAALHAVGACFGADILHVGPGQPFARLEDAVQHAAAGDTISVHPLKDGKPYEQVAVVVRTPRLTIRGAGWPHTRVILSGAGFEYSGVGSVPRAIVQLNPEADNCTIEGFEITDAHNASHNGAGIRINQANHVTVRGCRIHGNDMGIMSNGSSGPDSAVDQRIELCEVYKNGAAADPGQNHNLYLGGTSAVVSGCEIYSSTTGHNIKSRAHYTRVEYCYVHDSANREFDLVDAAKDTDVAASDAVILGCIISKKSPDMTGNRGVIHFGQDGGHEHTGTLFLINSTIVTPYQSPAVSLSAAGAKLSIANCLFTDGDSGQRNQIIAGVAGKADGLLAERLTSINSASSSHFAGLPGVARLGKSVAFADIAAGDFRVTSALDQLAIRGTPLSELRIPAAPGREGDTPAAPFLRYQHPFSTMPRTDGEKPCIGGFEAAEPKLPSQR